MSLESQFPSDLLHVIANLEDPSELETLFIDILTPSEIRSIRERWAIVVELAEGRSQREVKERVGVAIATVSRGAQQLRTGSGGFALAFEKLEELGLPHPPISRKSSSPPAAKPPANSKKSPVHSHRRGSR
ncbi:MAG: trp operon repressor [Myxococcales bacterium]|nr:trp operon repressor [Myxococcales bacterium]